MFAARSIGSLALALALAACGGDGGGDDTAATTTSTGTETPTTTTTATDPADTYVGAWLQTEDLWAGDCATQYPSAVGFYNVIDKVDATTVHMQACADVGCAEVLWDAGEWTVGALGAETQSFDMSYSATAHDCTYRQSSQLACAEADGNCVRAVVTGDQLLLLGAFAVTEEGGTECDAALAELQSTYGNAYPMDGCHGTEVAVMVKQ